MIASFGCLEFNFPWRSYQDHLLKNFNNHISDNHFHVIAPPGSGKTILGIEILIRLGKKTLILAPTLTIRNQWEDRLQAFFTKNKAFNKVSFDLKKPSDITFSTYQSLHAFYKTFEDKNAYYAFFKAHQIETLVLDEAHHLKNAWWTCLFDLKNNLPFYVVALTATPPYDSSRSEVSKYYKLCGDIDDEIAVPDLVKENDLCPHQDFVYFSKPEDYEINLIVDFRKKVAAFKDELLKDEDFIQFIREHRYYKNPNLHLEELYANTEYFSSILVFLNSCGIPIERSKLEILGFSAHETINFPPLHLEWLEVLFQNILVNDREQLLEHSDYLLQLEKTLRRLNVFGRNSVDFIGKKSLYKSLTNSPSKLNSVVSIVASEREALKEDLRCVILTDFIRNEFLNTENEKVKTINRIGVVPVFRYLLSFGSNKETLAVLTGSLVIIHKSVLEAFSKIENSKNYTFTPLEIDEDFLVVSSKIKSKNTIVSSITKLFETGAIQVLIGTKSLLGEGWDAPSINSLILASFIGSFVSSNQMRGRAIRKDSNQLNKTGNIWHLVCVDSTVTNGGRDVDTLRRRFDAFVGVSATNTLFISNGFDRLDVPENISVDMIDNLNSDTLKRAKDRQTISEKWQNSIGNGAQLSKEIRVLNLDEIPFKKQKQIYYFDAIRFFVLELFLAINLFYVEFVLKSFHLVLQRGVVYVLQGLLVTFLISFGYKLYKAISLYIKYGYLYKKIRKIGLAILDTLHELGYLTTHRNTLDVFTSVENKGDVICNLVGADAFENKLFSKALTEIIAPIDSPRYLIVKTNFFRSRLNIENFYAVPEIFGSKKAHVLVFQKYWNHYVGKSKVFFTRRGNGRRLLLKARLFHVSNAFKKVSKEVTIWK
ncbi:DEAD/DEAH box helicase family protein [Tamlana sp. I1]|uniref:DEAD/DEAH box helicase family protein n=1 Tax=Tamlana sp. I1 TaxID=2762061 RepID=UPI001E62B248|nr:DEAD/DEAH box helicase family protein [Tamlana sp. I1]